MADNFKSDLEMDRERLMEEGIDPDYNDEGDSLTGEPLTALDVGKGFGKAGLAYVQLLARKLGLDVYPTEDNMLGFDEGGLSLTEPDTPSFGDQMEMLFTPETPKEEPQKSPYSRRPGFRSLEEAKGQVSKEELLDGLDNAAEWMVPFYDAGTNMTNVISEYSKPEDERNYEYIQEELNKAGTSAGTEAAMYLMGGIVAKYGAKGLQALNKMRKSKTAKVAGTGLLASEMAVPSERDTKGYAVGGKVVKNLVEKYGKDVVEDVIEFFNVMPINQSNLEKRGLPFKEGGEFLRADTKESLTNRNAGSVNVKVDPSMEVMGGRPQASMKAGNLDVETVGSGKGSKIMVNLVKPTSKGNKAGWSWVNRVDPELDTNTLVSVEKGNNHYFTLETDFSTGANLTTYPNKKTEPRLRPTVKGELEFGDQIGTILLRGVEHPVYSKIKTFSEGGAVDDQMGAVFKSSRSGYALGGEVESVDPVSGNEVPVGSFASEVRDDIPAMLSEGEYVVPADVLRYYGLKFFEDLREQAKADLQRMDEDGRIGGEPVEAPMGEEISDEELMAMLSQMQGQPDQMNTGGYVSGYNQAGLVASNMNKDQMTNFALTPTVPMTPNLAGQYVTPGGITTNMQVGVPSPTGETPQSCAQKGMVYDEVTQQCVPMQQPTTQAPAVNNDNDDGPPTPVESKPWFESVNWMNPEETLGNYFGTQGKVGSAVAGVMGSMIGGPAVGAAFSQGSNVSNLANARAMVNIYEAMGMTEQAKMIQSQINTQLKNSKVLGIADKAIDAIFGSDGDIKTIQALKAAGIEVDSKLRDEELDEFLEGLKKDTSARDKLRSRYVPKAKPPVTTAKPKPTPEPTPSQPDKSPATAAASLAKQASNADNSSQLAAIQKAQKIAQKAADEGTTIAKQTQTGSKGYGKSSSSDKATGGKGSVSKGSGWGGMNKGGLMKKKK